MPVTEMGTPWLVYTRGENTWWWWWWRRRRWWWCSLCVHLMIGDNDYFDDLQRHGVESDPLDCLQARTNKHPATTWMCGGYDLHFDLDDSFVCGSDWSWGQLLPTHDNEGSIFFCILIDLSISHARHHQGFIGAASHDANVKAHLDHSETISKSNVN